LGEAPQVCISTTPRNIGLIKDIMANPKTVMTHAPTQANRAYLAEGFLDEVRARFAGTRMGRQELDGVLVEDIDGALWRSEGFDTARVSNPPQLGRVVVAVDPPVTGKSTSDECGIVVVGVTTDGPPHDWCAYVLEDCTVKAASPSEWARAAIEAMDNWSADRLVAEVNQGGDMVEAVIRQIDPNVAFRSVYASRGKVARAEPAVALYEQGRVKHLSGLDALEDQMCQMTTRGFEGQGSPDRVDALVWALTDMIIEPSRSWRRPMVRSV